MFSKVNVNGNDAHPIYQWLRTNSELKRGKIGWNFGKFLVSKGGIVIGYYGLTTDPEKMRSDIVNGLK